MSLYLGVKVCQYLKQSHYAPKQSHYAQLCSHLSGYHYAQNYAQNYIDIICQGLDLRDVELPHVVGYMHISSPKLSESSTVGL